MLILYKIRNKQKESFVYYSIILQNRYKLNCKRIFYGYTVFGCTFRHTEKLCKNIFLLIKTSGPMDNVAN